MTKISVNPELKTQLEGLLQQAEICDEAGQTLGHFFPEPVYKRLLYTWANSQISDEELQARLDEPGGESLADVWARLESQSK